MEQGSQPCSAWLSGDVQPTNGTVALDGIDPAKTAPVELALTRAYLGPRPLSRVEFSVRDVVEMGRHAHRKAHATTSAIDEAIVFESMVAVDVDGLADHTVATLSGGEAQRVGIARLLCQETPIALLDEPTSSLDIGHQALVMRAFRDRAAEGKVVVTVVHDLNLAGRFCDRLVLLDQGTVVSDGPPDEVLVGETLSQIYSCRITVIANPETGGPLVVPAV